MIDGNSKYELGYTHDSTLRHLAVRTSDNATVAGFINDSQAKQFIAKHNSSVAINCCTTSLCSNGWHHAMTCDNWGGVD